jgi:hypothetical protein
MTLAATPADGEQARSGQAPASALRQQVDDSRPGLRGRRGAACCGMCGWRRCSSVLPSRTMTARLGGLRRGEQIGDRDLRRVHGGLRAAGEALATILRMAGRRGRRIRRTALESLRRAPQLADGGIGLAEARQAVLQDTAQASGPAAALAHQVAARGEGAVHRLREVAGRDEQEVRMRLGERVELHQHGVGRAVDVDRIGLEAHFGPVGGERFDLVEQHDRRPAAAASAIDCEKRSDTARWVLPIAELVSVCGSTSSSLNLPPGTTRRCDGRGRARARSCRSRAVRRAG